MKKSYCEYHVEPKPHVVYGRDSSTTCGRVAKYNTPVLEGKTSWSSIRHVCGIHRNEANRVLSRMGVTERCSLILKEKELT